MTHFAISKSHYFVYYLFTFFKIFFHSMQDIDNLKRITKQIKKIILNIMQNILVHRNGKLFDQQI